MRALKYCNLCVMPNTKPRLAFDKEGVCDACRAHELKSARASGIDWEARGAEFQMLVRDARASSAPLYDVLVPVSGGKDSITQVHRLVDRDLRVVAVNVDYGVKTEIGRQNLGLIPDMGASLIVYRPEQSLHKRLIRIGFEDYGDPDLLSHALLHAYPLHTAMMLKVPLVLLGENSAFEYGGDEAVASQSRMSREWFTNFAATAGADARTVARAYGIPASKMRLYEYPDELDGSDVNAVFMSYFFRWDSQEHLTIARRYGFENLEGHAEGTYRNYVGIDEELHRVHQYMKVLKFGYGRATDHACEDIRNGRLTRDAAIDLVRDHDLQDLSPRVLEVFAEYVELPESQCLDVLERYRSRELWKRSADGRWCIPEHISMQARGVMPQRQGT